IGLREATVAYSRPIFNSHRSHRGPSLGLPHVKLMINAHYAEVPVCPRRRPKTRFPPLWLQFQEVCRRPLTAFQLCARAVGRGILPGLMPKIVTAARCCSRMAGATL